MYREGKKNLELSKKKYFKNKDNLNESAEKELNSNPHTEVNKVQLELRQRLASLRSEKQHTTKNLNQEASIESTRKKILNSFEGKISKEIIVPTLPIKSLHRFEETNLRLQHIITDIHANECFERKNMGDWGMPQAIERVTTICNNLIDMQKNAKIKYKSLELGFLGDIVGTEIHKGIKVDTESNRAAKFMASLITQCTAKLLEHFPSITLVFVPGNHAETRESGQDKNDLFQENYDFYVAEYTKEYIMIKNLSNVTVQSPDRDTPVIAIVEKNVNNQVIHGYAHGDRFNSKFAPMSGLLKAGYTVDYLDFYHQGHLHNEDIKYDQGIMKFTYPCVTEVSSYGQNRYGAHKVIGAEDQLGNIYSMTTGEILTTYNMNIDKKNNKYFTPDIDLKDDISDITMRLLTMN